MNLSHEQELELMRAMAMRKGMRQLRREYAERAKAKRERRGRRLWYANENDPEAGW